MIKINYFKKYGTDGTVYNQTIKIDSKIAENFNEYIKNLKESTTKKFILSNEDMKILYYLEELKNQKNYATLTTINYFKKFYLKNIYENNGKKDLFFERILNRNTIFEII